MSVLVQAKKAYLFMAYIICIYVGMPFWAWTVFEGRQLIAEASDACIKDCGRYEKLKKSYCNTSLLTAANIALTALQSVKNVNDGKMTYCTPEEPSHTAWDTAYDIHSNLLESLSKGGYLYNSLNAINISPESSKTSSFSSSSLASSSSFSSSSSSVESNSDQLLLTNPQFDRCMKRFIQELDNKIGVGNLSNNKLLNTNPTLNSSLANSSLASTSDCLEKLVAQSNPISPLLMPASYVPPRQNDSISKADSECIKNVILHSMDSSYLRLILQLALNKTIKQYFAKRLMNEVLIEKIKNSFKNSNECAKYSEKVSIIAYNRSATSYKDEKGKLLYKNLFMSRHSDWDTWIFIDDEEMNLPPAKGKEPTCIQIINKHLEKMSKIFKDNLYFDYEIKSFTIQNKLSLEKSTTNLKQLQFLSTLYKKDNVQLITGDQKGLEKILEYSRPMFRKVAEDLHKLDEIEAQNENKKGDKNEDQKEAPKEDKKEILNRIFDRVIDDKNFETTVSELSEQHNSIIAEYSGEKKIKKLLRREYPCNSYENWFINSKAVIRVADFKDADPEMAKNAFIFLSMQELISRAEEMSGLTGSQISKRFANECSSSNSGDNANEVKKKNKEIESDYKYVSCAKLHMLCSTTPLLGYLNELVRNVQPSMTSDNNTQSQSLKMSGKDDCFKNMCKYLHNSLRSAWIEANEESKHHSPNLEKMAKSAPELYMPKDPSSSSTSSASSSLSSSSVTQSSSKRPSTASSGSRAFQRN